MAIISTNSGDYFGGQELSINASPFFDKRISKQHIFIKSNLNNLGFASENLKDYNQAIVFYTEALNYITGANPEAILKNNIANIYRKRKAYQKAIAIYQSVLDQKLDRGIFARILSNIAITKWLQNPSYKAAPELLSALRIRKKDNDLLGINASYAHLADYYTDRKPDSALFYANRRYQNAMVINQVDDRLEGLQKLIKLSPPAATKQYFQTYQNLSDSIQTVRSAAKNQFAVIRYASEKNKADFLKAQAENIEKQQDILLRNIGIGALVICLILGYLFYRRRQKSLKQEKEIEVKKTELKYVKKVHDGVANKIYQVMSEVENDHEMNKTILADKLEVIYKISRDLSYENSDIDTKEGFAKELLKMLYAYSSANVDIEITGNDEELWKNVKATIKDEVYLILQNLMTNMGKHSGADRVSITFERKDACITVSYFDNGKGMKGVVKKNGLNNTETRIENISGRITFDTKPDEGLDIKFSFPI
ncbi:tetratricopeptide repeat-containing sensor histidine kinase [Pedobacter sp. AJM]|uniref:tetratricopeptide repeat-containing sensor histidine kinase n=1 Tax=Pedobacter sp. AJM TaxID=2003629 RepID=UPI0015552DED|nr:tetratricopeptide repeat-containing sensor histidine kinase [Pedobacter sp. AJM]